MFKPKNITEKISLYALLLEILGIIIILSTMLTLIVRWTQDKILFLQDVDFWIPFLDRCIECLQTNSIHYLQALSLYQRMLGFLTDGVTMLIVVSAIYCAIRLMRLFRLGIIFSLETVGLLRNISKLALLWALYSPINVYIMNKIAFHTTHAAEQKLIMAYVTDDVILKLVFFGFILVISLMMQEGYRLKHEQDLTV